MLLELYAERKEAHKKQCIETRETRTSEREGKLLVGIWIRFQKKESKLFKAYGISLNSFMASKRMIDGRI